MLTDEQTPFFRLRELKQEDFGRLMEIAAAINQKAARDRKKGYFPFYAFQMDADVADQNHVLAHKVQSFLDKAKKERAVWPRSTYRLGVENKAGCLIGNVTVDMLPIHQNGQIVYGDLGYFVEPSASGQGIMTKAVCFVLKHYFKSNERLDVTAHPDNLYSRRLIERIGGREVGFMGKSPYQSEPRAVFVVLKRDFEAALSHLEKTRKIKHHSRSSASCFQTRICQNQR